MTVHIVDFLESIEVDAKQRKCFVAGRCALECLRKVIAERRSVGQFGERIVKGQVRDAGFTLRALGDVLMRCDQSAILNRLVGNVDDPAVGPLRGETVG